MQRPIGVLAQGPRHRPAAPRRVRASGLLLVAGLLFLLLPGCVRRRLTVRSDPPGAMVYIDDQQIGVTPVATSYTYYGTRNFVLQKDGYETVEASRTFNAPFYEIPPLDFIAENLWPFELRDERVVDFQMVPQQTVQTDRLIERAQDLRTSASQGHAAPLPNCAPPGGPPANMTIPPTQSLFPPPASPSAEPVPTPWPSFEP